MCLSNSRQQDKWKSTVCTGSDVHERQEQVDVFLFLNEVPDHNGGLCLFTAFNGSLFCKLGCNVDFSKKLLLNDEAANWIGSDSSYITKHKQTIL